MKDFGFNEYLIELSTRPEKSIGSDQMWGHATDALKEALKKKGLKYDVHEGEGAFYGPKIDIKLKDAIGRSWQCATIQCDFALPERFDLNYVDESGNQKRPVMIHRVLLGSIERFIGTLIEHHGGAMPVWLSPVQAAIIPVSDKFNDYAEKIKKELLEKNIRSQINIKNETLGKKIREAQMEKVPYMLIIGEKEQKQNKVALRSRVKGDQGMVGLDEFIQRVNKEITSKQ
jgi:threonyl-tRNA synthetase